MGTFSKSMASVGGFIADRLGRKPVMLIAQAAHGLAYILMSRASSYAGFLLPMTVMGACMPFYSVGSDSMMADMIPPQNRTNAYSILRMINNAGIAIGPAIGGLLVSHSYTLAFRAASSGMLMYSLLLLFFVRETLHRNDAPAEILERAETFGGYGRVLKDAGENAKSRTVIACCALLSFIVSAAGIHFSCSIGTNVIGRIFTSANSTSRSGLRCGSVGW